MEEYKLTEEEKMLLKASQVRYERKCENCGGKYPFSREDILSERKQIKTDKNTGIYEYKISRRYIKCKICDYEEEIE